MKIIPLLTSILLAFSACLQHSDKVDLQPDKLDINNMNHSWLTDYDSISHHINFYSPWGGRGWIYGEEDDSTTFFDASEYDKVVVCLEGIQGPVTKLNLVVMYAGSTSESRDMSTIVDGATTMRVELNPELKSRVKRIFLLCDTLCEMNITNAYYDKAHHYGPAKPLTMSPIGIISADQFDGYSDNALVEMTFESKGNIMGINMYGENVDMTGWAIGIICSAADILGAELPTRGIVLRNLGVQKYTCLLGDIRYLLSLSDDDGECGIYWTVWKIGGINEVKILGTTIAEAED